MNNRLLVQMNEEDLYQIVRKVIREEISNINLNDEDDNCEVNKKQAAELLDVCESTIDNWSKEGFITKYARGHRRYFLKKELLASKTGIINKKVV
jgi:hypothetical protein